MADLKRAAQIAPYEKSIYFRLGEVISLRDTADPDVAKESLPYFGHALELARDGKPDEFWSYGDTGSFIENLEATLKEIYESLGIGRPADGYDYTDQIRHLTL